MANAELPRSFGRQSSHWKTIAIAVLATLVFALVFSSNAKPNDPSDFLNSTDDMVRMVIVRDWLAGQSWFDPILHRLGFEPGTIMHWSRLVDLPIGLLISFGNFIGLESGERFAATAWPLATFVLALVGLLTAVRNTSGSDNVIPSLIIGGFALWSWGAFEAGAIDHHNIQSALAIWVVALVLPWGNATVNFRMTGIVMAISLAIGLESLPIVFAGAMAILLRLVIERDALYDAVRQFGLALGLTITLLYFLLIGPQNYAQSYCDSLSLFHLVCAGAGGGLLYGIMHPRISAILPMPFFTAPAIAGALIFAIALAYFPECLADPVSGIDPVLRHFWLDAIIEAQNVFKIAALDPWLLVFQHAITVIAFGALIRMLVTGEQRLLAGVLLIFLTVTTAVTLFQLRGILQSVAVAGFALSIIATRFMEGPGKEKPILGIAVLIVFCNQFWKYFVIALLTLLQVNPGPLMTQSAFKIEVICRTPEDLMTLNAEKPGFIAAANGLGAWLLYSTHHRVLAGPYHRNGEGNLASVNIMTGSEEQAHKIMRDGGVTLFAACPQFVDEEQILKEVPNGFLGKLLAGKTPDWLEPVESTMDKSLKLWRVR